MTRKWFGSLLGLLVLSAVLDAQSRESLLQTIADQPGWTAAGEPIQYDEKNIEKLAGNRSRAVVRYGLAGATVQSWMGPQGRVRMTLYEMSDGSAAYGLFTLERDIGQPGFTALTLGTEGFRVGNRSMFWQSKYVVRLEGEIPAMESFGRLISENILGRSRKPPVSTHLPPENLIPGTEKYAVDESSIGRHLKLDPGSLGFSDSVEIAMADYRVGGQLAHLVLMLYPTQQIAKRYADQFDGAAGMDTAFGKRVGPLVALVRGSADPEVAKSILDGVNYESQVTWNEPRPDISLRDLILTIFNFIGIALFFTLVAGIGFGGLRIFVKSRYPDRVFDRPEAMEIIQLKLAQGFTNRQLHD